MRNFLLALAATFGFGAAQAQTLNVMRSLEAPHFDTQRTTWGPTGETALLIQDTLTDQIS